MYLRISSWLCEGISLSVEKKPEILMNCNYRTYQINVKWDKNTEWKLSLEYINFFDRATSKAVEAAIQSRQWLKAVQILEIQDSSMSAKYYKQIADHYASIGEYEVQYTWYFICNLWENLLLNKHKEEISEEYYK